MSTTQPISVGQTYKGDFATYTVLAIAASGVTVRNIEGGYDGAYQPGSFETMVERGHVILLEGARDEDGNSLETADALADFNNPCDEPSEPVTWTGPDGAVWHLTDANGPPVTAGIHEGEDYSFRITARPDVVADAHGTPFKVEMFWLLIDGETRDGRHPAYTNTPFLADGWTWTTSA